MIIVTGGAGFIGSALIWRLNQEGFKDIIIVDDFGQGPKWRNLVKRDFTRVININDFIPWLNDSHKKPPIEVIFHMGACSSTTETNVDFLYRNNVLYSIHLFEYCRTHKIPFIYASSAATYGSEESDFSDQQAGKTFLTPINPYGYSKELFDRWVAKQVETPPYWCGLKFFNVFGPNEYHKEGQSSVIFQAYPQIKDQGQLRLFKSYRPDIADGEQKRDFVYVKDVVEVMLNLYRGRKELHSGIYNLGSGRAHSFNDLADAVFDAMNFSQKKIVYIDMPESLKDQYQYFTEANLERLRKQGLASFKFTPFATAVRDYVQNYLVCKDPYL